jgi:hypothetical protein
MRKFQNISTAARDDRHLIADTVSRLPLCVVWLLASD